MVTTRQDSASEDSASEDGAFKGGAPEDSASQSSPGVAVTADALDYYNDPASWAAVGYRQLPAGVRWPTSVAPTPRTTPLAALAPAGDAYDVVVVGAGAGGGVAAHVLTAAGLHVLLVDRGPNAARDDLPHDLLTNARVNTGRQRQLDPPAAGNPRVVQDEVLATPDARWGGVAFAVGGGTRVYGAQAWRFSPEDFRMGTEYGPDFPDWPITYDDLEPWYEIVEQELGVAGAPDRRPHDGPRRRPYPMPPFAPTPIDEVLGAGAAALGIEAAAVPLLINTVPHGGRPACIRCGTCVGFACWNESRAGTHNTVIPRAVASGHCDLTVGTVAERLVLDARGTVVGVALVGADGLRRTIRSRHTVLAAGAVETARLLLLSEVGTGHDQVGRYLQSHPYAGAVGIFDDIVQTCLGPGPTTSTTQYRHHVPGVLGGGILANEFVPPPVEYWTKIAPFGLLPDWGPGAVDAVAHAYPRTAWLMGPVQEVPSSASRVRVSDSVRDARGLPVARLSGDGPHAQDRVATAFLAERAEAWLRASGARTVARTGAPAQNGVTPAAGVAGVSAGQHQAGTARMGDDPRSSVTDTWGRVWGHRGITVADTSLHVTNGGVNPVLTALALSWRVSSHLVDELA